MVGFEEPRAAALDALAWARPSALAQQLRDYLFGSKAAKSLLDTFSEEDERRMYTSRAPSQWQEQLRLALVALAVLLVGQRVNALLGYAAAGLRRRRLARDMALNGTGGAARTAVRSWPARFFGRQPVKRSTWDDASLLVGDWVLDAEASDSLEGLYDVLDYGWRERLAASYLTELSIEEDQKTWRLVVMAAGGLVYGAALDETYLKTGAPTLVPRRDTPGDENASADGQADGRPLCEARAAPLDGGVEVRHVLGDPSRGLLREWFGVTEEPGEAVLVRETVYKLETGEEWSGVLVYRTPPPEPKPGGKAPPAAKPLTLDAAALLAAARTRIASDEGDAGDAGHQIGAPDEPGNAIADECGRWDESLLNAALRRVRLLPDEVVVEDKKGGHGDEAEAMEVEVPAGPVEAPAAITAMADLLLSAMPRTFGGVPAREATAEEKALLESVEQLGQLRITAEQAEALRASGENVTAPPMPSGPIRERDQMQAWLAARRTRMR